MKFMITWSLRPEHQKQAITRFLDTGAPPPTGIQMLGRWHGPGIGFVLAETDNAKAIYEWLAVWLDVIQFGVTPVIEDAEAAEVFQKSR